MATIDSTWMHFVSQREKQTLSRVAFRIRLAIAAIFLLGPGIVGSATSGPPGKLPQWSVTADGALTFSIPIEAPLPTAGMGPALAITYHSGAGNGMLGLGGILSGLGSIQRDSSRGIDYRGSDSFRSSESGELVSTNTGEYRAKVDNAVVFLSEGLCGDGPCSWRSILPDGTIQYFGETPETRVQGPEETDAGIAEWALSRVQDRSGNFWLVEYDKREGSLYPRTIRYTMNSGVSLAERSITLSYEERPDPILSNAGRRSRMSKRLASIATSGGSSYTLEYQEVGSARLSAFNRIALTGLSGGSYAAMTFGRANENAGYSVRATSWPVDAGQGPVDPNICQTGITACANTMLGANPVAAALCALYVLPNPMIGTSGHVSCMTGDSQSLADINGDGHTDFVRATGLLRDIQAVTFLNQDSGIGESASAWQYAGDSPVINGMEWQIVTDENGNETAVLTGDPPASFDEHQYGRSIKGSPYLFMIVPYTPTGSGRYYVDVNGDGRSDFVRAQGGRWLVSLSNGNTLDAPSVWSAPRGTGIKTFRMWADLNGDGKSDYIRLLDNSRIAVARSNGGGFLSDTVTGLDGTGLSHQMGDVNGDGVLDFIRFKPGELIYNRGRVDGSFESTAVTQAIPTGYEDFQIVVDVNADGLGDYVRVVGGSREYVALSLGNGRTFGETTYTGIPGVPGEIQRPTVADMNGDGKLDFVSFAPDGGGYAPAVYVQTGNAFSHSTSIGGAAFPAVPPGVMPQYSDTNGDGIAEVLFPGADGRFMMVSRPSHRPGLLTSISDGAGKQVQITYSSAVNSGAIPAGGSSAGSYSVVGNTTPQFLATSVQLVGPGGPKSRTDYTYAGGRLKVGPTRRDSKSLGFESITTRSYIYNGSSWQPAATYSVQRSHQNHPTLGYDGAGLPIEQVTYRSSNDSVLSRVTSEFARPPGYAIAGTVKIAQISTTTEDRSTAVPVTSRSSVTAFDAMGNPTRVLEEPDTSSPGSAKMTEISYTYPATQPNGQVSDERITGSGSGISCKQYTYDGAGRVTSLAVGITCSALIATETDYNAVGKPVEVRANGMTTRYSYDPATLNHAVSITLPGGLVSEREYDTETGQMTSETDANGIVTVHEYDSYGRKTEVKRGSFLASFLGTSLESNTFNLNSDGSGNIRTTRPFDGIRSLDSFTHLNEWGQTLETQREGAAGMVSTEKTYDALGRLLSESLPHNSGGSAPGAIAYSYDDLDRQIRVTIPNGSGGLIVDSNPANPDVAVYSSQAGVTLRGYAVKETKPNGQRIYQYKTVDGRVIQLEYETSFASNASPNTSVSGWARVRYHYDASGKIVAVTRGSGVVRGSIVDNPEQQISIEYDAFGRRTAVTEPDKGRSTFTYNSKGLVECTASPGETTCQTYDDAGRPIRLTKDTPGGTVLATYTYDTGTNGVGKLASVTDEAGTRAFDYDALTGNITNTKRTYVHPGNTKHFDIVDDYTPGGLLARREYPALNLSLLYDYYPGGFLKRVTLNDPDRRILDSGSELVLVSYGVPDAMGTVPSVQYANGVTVDYTYEPTTGKMRTLKAQSTSAGVIADYAYQVDDEGLLLAVTDNLIRDGVDLSETFTYDKAHRLTEAQGPYGDKTSPGKTLRYTYGADGQPLFFGDRTIAYGSNEHRVDDSGVVRYTGFDAMGNVVERRKSSGSTKTLTYSYHNRIKSVTMSGNETGQVNFTYDSEGDRFLKRYQKSGVDLHTYNMSPEYQMRRVSGEEIHTLLVNKADGALASLSYNSLYLISNAAAPPSLYKNRLLADTSEIANLSSRNLGTKGPQVFASVKEDLKLLFASVRDSWDDPARPDTWKQDRRSLRTLHDWILALFALAGVFSAVSVLRLWLKDRINPIWTLPRAFGRITAVCILISFTSMLSSCVATGAGGDDNEIGDGILAAAAASGAFQDPDNPDIPALIAEMDGLIGNHFYITNQVNSNHLVTDVNGKLVCKYVYEPYGKLNMTLTDTDPDKDGVHFLALKKFTGQEFDYETGLYNYNARLYDQETGRFLQPDPVHAEHVGYDNYDRYQYVHSNPVNFTDPTGETALISAMIGGIKWAGTSIGNGLKWAGSGIAGGLKWAGTGIGNATTRVGTAIGNGAREVATGGAFSRHERKGLLGALDRLGGTWLDGHVLDPLSKWTTKNFVVAIGTFIGLAFICPPCAGFLAEMATLGALGAIFAITYGVLAVAGLLASFPVLTAFAGTYFLAPVIADWWDEQYPGVERALGKPVRWIERKVHGPLSKLRLSARPRARNADEKSALLFLFGYRHFCTGSSGGCQ